MRNSDRIGGGKHGRDAVLVLHSLDSFLSLEIVLTVRTIC